MKIGHVPTWRGHVFLSFPMVQLSHHLAKIIWIRKLCQLTKCLKSDLTNKLQFFLYIFFYSQLTRFELQHCDIATVQHLKVSTVRCRHRCRGVDTVLATVIAAAAAADAAVAKVVAAVVAVALEVFTLCLIWFCCRFQLDFDFCALKLKLALQKLKSCCHSVPALQRCCCSVCHI